jgi:hypothetical protein
MSELRGGLPIDPEALQPSEHHHSPDKAKPSYYTKNKSFASAISKVWCVCSDFHRRGVFIGPSGSSSNLAEAVTRHVAAGRPGGTASTALSFLLSCRHVSTKPQAELTYDLASRPAPRPVQPGVWPTRSTC